MDSKELTNEEISELRIKAIYDTICKEMKKKVYNLRFYLRKTKDEIDSINYTTVQFAINEKYNRMYIMYELDNTSRRYIGYSEVCEAINYRLTRLYRTYDYYKEIGSFPIIVGPTAKISRTENMGLPYTDTQKEMIKLDVVSCWKCFDGVYRFIEDKSISDMKMNLFAYKSSLSLPQIGKKIVNFTEAANEINSRYDYDKDNQTSVVNAFNEYNALFENQFKVPLIAPIKDEEITTFYIEVKWNKEYLESIIPKLPYKEEN